jgi:threonine dehydrogenase-like Zn-dependent dehydrogenase
MKAVIFRQHGSLDMLEYVEDMPVPEIGPDETLVRVQVAALNRLDQFVTKGWKGLELELPHIPGADFSGVLVAMGEQVRGWTAGDRQPNPVVRPLRLLPEGRAQPVRQPGPAGRAHARQFRRVRQDPCPQPHGRA